MVTAAQLEPLLRDRLGDAVTCGEPLRAAVGNGQETWLVDAHGPSGDLPLVLRRSAPDGTLAWTDRRAEFGVLAAVGAAGLPVPRVLWLDEDGGELERPYFVMERLPGRVPGRLEPAERDALSRELGGWLARLHALDPDGLVDADDGRPAPGDAGSASLAERAAWQGRYERDRLAPIPLLGALFAWLEAHPPASGGRARMLWGDAGPHNLLVHDGRISALLDWELVHLGDPLDDLAVAQWSCFGTLDADAVLAGYEAQTAQAVDRERLRWHRVLACCSRATMLLAGVRAYAEGRSANPSLAGLGLDLLARTLAQGAAEAGWPGAAPAPDGGGAADRPDLRAPGGEGTAQPVPAAVAPGPTDVHAPGDEPAGPAPAGDVAPGPTDVHAPDDEPAGPAPAGDVAPGPTDVHAPDDEPAGPAPADVTASAAAVARPDAAETAAGVARFLRDDVLPATTDAALRRGLKTAVALLDTTALRSRDEPAATAAREARTAALLRERGLGDDLEAAARRCELDPDRAADRDAVRALLLADHADADTLLAPLRRLFGG